MNVVHRVATITRLENATQYSVVAVWVPQTDTPQVINVSALYEFGQAVSSSRPTSSHN